MYTFSKPRYEVYPYSQHDIPPSSEYQHQQDHSHYLRHYPSALVNDNEHYYNKQPHTSVEIQPSQSYEIKQTDHGYKTIYHGSDDGYNSAADDQHIPVIVLRVPGPAKYAAHLQALLQRYIEVRAAQYLQAIQEQEAHGVDSSQQQDHGQDSYLGSYGGLPVLPYGPQQAYVPAQMYLQPVVPMHAYFPQHSLENPYANAHIAQTVDLGEDHSHSAEDGGQHQGKLDFWEHKKLWKKFNTRQLSMVLFKVLYSQQRMRIKTTTKNRSRTINNTNSIRTAQTKKSSMDSRSLRHTAIY